MSGRHRRGGCCRNPAAACHIAAQCVPLLTRCHNRDGSLEWDDRRSTGDSTSSTSSAGDRVSLVARGGEVTAAPTPSVAPTHTPTSSEAAAAFHELAGSSGSSQSNTDCLAATNGVPTPEQALLIARRDILVAEDQVHVHRVVSTLGMALGATRMVLPTIRALHAVLLQQARPGMNDAEAYRTTGASRSNFTKWRRWVQRIQSFEHFPSSVRYFMMF